MTPSPDEKGNPEEALFPDQELFINSSFHDPIVPLKSDFQQVAQKRMGINLHKQQKRRTKNIHEENKKGPEDRASGKKYSHLSHIPHLGYRWGDRPREVRLGATARGAMSTGGAAAVTQPPLTPSPREVWTAKKLPPTQILSTTSLQTTPDLSANTCFKNMQVVDNFCRDQFQRCPVPNSTRLMKAYIYDANAYNNAFWQPQTQDIHFGEVDPRIFRQSFETSLDVTMHEFGHSITSFSADLVYRNQSGALNESLSDVWAIMLMHHSKNQRANDPNASWLIGENVIATSDGTSGSLRSMSRPGTAYQNHPILKSDPQPDHMNRYDQTLKDNGGVHTNSGIPNRAFHLAAVGLQEGSWLRVGHVWMEALSQSQSTDDFATFANRTITVANQRYSGQVANIVGKAWQDVGVLPQAQTAASTAPSASWWKRGACAVAGVAVVYLLNR